MPMKLLRTALLLLACAPPAGCLSDDSANPPIQLCAPSAGSAGCAGSSPGPTPEGPPDRSVGPLGERADLPIDARTLVAGLSAPADVVRDRYGRPHVYAATLRDAMLVEGYLVALDRTAQLDLLRRSATGRLAEVLGDLSADTIDQDIVMRHVGLARTAAAQYAALTDPEVRASVDAYASGVTQAFRRLRSGNVPMPAPLATTYPLDAFEDWTGVDSLAVARLQAYLLSYTVDGELYNEQFLADAQGLFAPDSADPQLARRAGIERDLWRMTPLDPVYTSSTTAQSAPKLPARTAAPRAPRPAATSARSLGAYVSALEGVRAHLAPEGFGSNAWSIAPSLSANGHALLANDPHLSLNSPTIFWPFSFHVGPEGEGLHASGVAFPGVPGLILGHNQHVGWGATVAGYDVTDIYSEQLSPDGSAVTFQGRPVPLETIEERIAVRNGEPRTYRVKVVPHHGPIIPTIAAHQVQDPDPAARALSVRWTGHEPTPELEAIFALHRAASVDQARAALARFRVGAQNWLVADTAGNLLWTSHAAVPRRAPAALTWSRVAYAGNLPCLVLPGDGSAEWQGDLGDDLVPWEKNPPDGYIVSANNDPVGATGDGDATNDLLPDGTPLYLHCTFDPGVRAARIRDLLRGAKKPISTEAMIAMQGDVRSALGSRLIPFLLEAIARGDEELAQPGSHPDLTKVVGDPRYDRERVAGLRALLEAWGAEADFAAASGLNPDTGEPLSEQAGPAAATETRAARATLVFNTWLVRLLWRVFGDEYERMGRTGLVRSFQLEGILHLLRDEPGAIATFDPVAGESALWDDLRTPEAESRHDRALRALLDATEWLDVNATGAAAFWGAHHRVQLAPANPLWFGMAIPPLTDPIFPSGFPRPGDHFAIDSAAPRASFLLEQPPQFTFAGGPAQRIVIDLDPAGPRAFGSFPGGAVWDPASPHFRDEAELWRKNETHLIPFVLSDVIATKESRAVLHAGASN